MHHHVEQNDLIVDIFLQIANEKNKSLEHVKRLLLIEENTSINYRFWELLDERSPGHSFTYVGCCAECGYFELR
jgi:hypothetical protein